MAQMEEYMRKCDKVGEIAVMEVGGGRVVTTRAMEVVSSSSSCKRRKLASNAGDRIVNSRCAVNTPANSFSPPMSKASDRISVSRCSSKESREYAKHETGTVDLQVESQPEAFETEISVLSNCRFSKEWTSSSELCAEADEMESSTASKPSAASRRQKQPEPKVPPAAEVEEFFSAAERLEQKRFSEKYNYDVKKDVPLEGQYQWTRLKP